MMRTFALTTSPLLQDADRDPICIDAQAKLCGPSGLHQDCFAAKGVAEFSLGDGFMESFLKGETPEDSPASFLQQPLLWKLLRAHIGQLHLLPKAWMSCMVEPGTLLYSKGSGNVSKGLVVYACVYGMLGHVAAWRQGEHRAGFHHRPEAVARVSYFCGPPRGRQGEVWHAL